MMRTPLLTTLFLTAALSATPAQAADLLCPGPGSALLNYCVEIVTEPVDTYTVEQQGQIDEFCVTSNVCTPPIPLYGLVPFQTIDVYQLGDGTYVDPDIGYALQWVCDAVEDILGNPFCEVPTTAWYAADGNGDGFVDGVVIGDGELFIYAGL